MSFSQGYTNIMFSIEVNSRKFLDTKISHVLTFLKRRKNTIIGRQQYLRNIKETPYWETCIELSKSELMHIKKKYSSVSFLINKMKIS